MYASLCMVSIQLTNNTMSQRKQEYIIYVQKTKKTHLTYLKHEHYIKDITVSTVW